MEVEYSGGGVLIFSYLIPTHQRDTFGGLYDKQVEPRQLDTCEFIGCALMPANSVQTGFARNKLSRGSLIRVSSLAAALMAHQ